MEKIVDIIEAMAHEKNISLESAVDAFKEALIKTAKRCTTYTSHFEATVDMDRKDYRVEQIIIVAEDRDERFEKEPDSVISLEEAQEEYGSDIELGDELRSNFILEDHGRTASHNLFRELQYHIQRQVEQDLFEKYRERVGTVMIGTVNRIDDKDNTFIEIGELKGILSQRNRIKGEKFKRGDTVKALLRYVSIDPEMGMFLELTRTAPRFLEKLMEKEVPEIGDETVEIIASARIPGQRAKLALKTDFPNIDPIGAAVGVKGVRINAVSAELNGENIDCVEYSPIPEVFITRALSPAIIQSLKVTDPKGKKVLVNITNDQKAKAIGKSGINIRLASMLTGYTIELNEIEGITNRTGDGGKKSSNEIEKTTSTDALADLFK
ncbi:transcription termination/antitermination protein NusA [Sulfurovum sp. bin170]|uniref:transcription termination factor NusA n=1 Tax=Sulfurovum sp. bin170 TaxID=2695268 RepID=UPI0013DEEF91|nr:transcription termination factor NusA [Sulfurovum sp. bin170]NEW60094.1 transcription termination/antitermination protein NusA [Sulfurovum sp. bin170]